MDLKERLRSLTKLDPYIQGVFAFMNTRVETKWRSTGSVDCIRAEQIADYVLKNRDNKKLSKKECQSLVKAATALKNFSDSKQKGQQKRSF